MSTRGACGGTRSARPTSSASTPTATSSRATGTSHRRVFLHTELHRARADAAVIVHNHPYYATLLAAIGELPRIVHQNSCIFDDELAFVDEYALVEGARRRPVARRRRSARRRASCSRTTARSSPRPTIEEACYKAVTFERMCRFTYDILRAGREPVEIAPPTAPRRSKAAAARRTTPRAYWDGAVRQLLAREPEVLRVTGMSIDDLASIGRVRWRQGPARTDHLAARARTAATGATP